MKLKKVIKRGERGGRALKVPWVPKGPKGPFGALWGKVGYLPYFSPKLGKKCELHSGKRTFFGVFRGLFPNLEGITCVITQG